LTSMPVGCGPGASVVPGDVGADERPKNFLSRSNHDDMFSPSVDKSYPSRDRDSSDRRSAAYTGQMGR
jgi:hypothetical protein